MLSIIILLIAVFTICLALCQNFTQIVLFSQESYCFHSPGENTDTQKSLVTYPKSQRETAESGCRFSSCRFQLFFTFIISSQGMGRGWGNLCCLEMSIVCFITKGKKNPFRTVDLNIDAYWNLESLKKKKKKKVTSPSDSSELQKLQVILRCSLCFRKKSYFLAAPPNQISLGDSF